MSLSAPQTDEDDFCPFLRLTLFPTGPFGFDSDDPANACDSLVLIMSSGANTAKDSLVPMSSGANTAEFEPPALATSVISCHYSSDCRLFGAATSRVTSLSHPTARYVNFVRSTLTHKKPNPSPSSVLRLCRMSL